MRSVSMSFAIGLAVLLGGFIMTMVYVCESLGL